MRWIVLLGFAGCASAQVAPTFAMESDHHLLVQVTRDKGDVDDSPFFENLLRKSSNQVHSTKHRRSRDWVRIDAGRVAKLHDDAVVDEDHEECIVDGDRVRCGDAWVSYGERGVEVVPDSTRGWCTWTRVDGGEVCMTSDGPYKTMSFLFRPDGGEVQNTPAELSAVAPDGKSATVVNHDAYGARIGTFAFADGTLQLVRWRDFAFAEPKSKITAITPDAAWAMVSREQGCDVVEIATGDSIHDEACNGFVGNVARFSGKALVDLRTGARTEIGVAYAHQTDRTVMIARTDDRTVVIRTSDAAVAVLPVVTEHVVVGERLIAAVGAGQLGVVDRETMQVRVEPVAGATRAIGIAGDTVFVGLGKNRLLAVTDGRKAILPLGK